MINNLLRADR